MKTRLAVALCLGIFASAGLEAFGQDANPFLKPPTATHESPPPNSTEVWLYNQEMRRYEDPAQAVRRKAEAQAAQRMQRLASMKWYGMSNSRPIASPVPTMDYYSPMWSGTYSTHPYQWSGVASTPRAVYVTPSYLR